MKPLLKGVFLIVALTSAFLLPAGRADAQIDQRALAERIRSNDPDERFMAVEMARSIGPAGVGPELRGALIGALEDANSAYRRAVGQGVAAERFVNPEFRLRVSITLAKLRDPRAIPALTGALGTLAVARGLAYFGELAALPVIEIVRSPDSQLHEVNDGLLTLRFMIDRAETSPLSPATLALIRSVARQRLTGKQSVTVLWNAIDLAVALNDPVLRRIATTLANDPEEVIARGVTDPDFIEKTRKRASDRLAGVPPMPRWQEERRD